MQRDFEDVLYGGDGGFMLQAGLESDDEVAPAQPTVDAAAVESDPDSLDDEGKFDSDGGDDSGEG